MSGSSYWQRVVTDHAVGRRTFLRSAGVAGVGAAAFLAGCRGSSPAPTSNAGAGAAGGAAPNSAGVFAVPEAKRGGTITISGSNPTTGWDPHKETINTTGLVTDPMGIKLVRHDYRKTPPWKSGSEQLLIGELAEKWETPDRQVYTYTLRNGVNWPDQDPMNGRPITAEDVAYSFTHALLPSSVVQGYVFDNIASATAIDARTVQIKLKAPNWDFANLMDSFNTMIVPKGIYDWTGPDGMKVAEKARGGGPWMLDEFRPGSAIFWKANLNYRKAFGTPYTDKMVVALLAGGAPQLQAFASKQTQFFGVPAGQLETVKTARPDAKMKIDEFSAQNGQALWMNTIQKPFDDVRVRRAISMGVDRDGWGKTLGSSDYKLENGPVSWGFPEWKLDPKTLPAETGAYLKLNQAESKKLLAAAGVSSSTEYTISSYEYDPSYTAGALLLLDQLSKVGLTTKLRQLEFNNYVATVRKGQYTDMVYTQHALDRVSEQLVDRFSKTGSRNQSNVQDETTQQLVKDFWSAKGPVEAKVVSDKLQFRSIDEAFALYRPAIAQQLMWDPSIQNYEGATALNWSTPYRTAFYWLA